MKELSYFANFGNYAPSSHNAKMWKVETDSIKSRIIIVLKAASLLPQVDPQNRESWISLGAFTQNIIFIASDFGYDSNVVLQNDTVIVNFQRSLNSNTQYEFLLKKRKTTRKPFDKDKIDDIIVNAIQNYKNAIYIKSGSPAFQTLVKLSQQANIQQVNDYKKREELAQWINFENKRKVGITLKNLGLNAFERFVFRYFIRKRGFVNSRIVRKGIIKKTNQLYSECAGYVLIKSTANTQKKWFTAGLELQKIWVELTKYNIAVHPMSQILEEEPYYTQFRNCLTSKGEIQMVLRVGIQKETPTGSHR